MIRYMWLHMLNKAWRSNLVNKGRYITGESICMNWNIYLVWLYFWVALKIGSSLWSLLFYFHFPLGMLRMPDLDTVVEEMSVVNAKWESIGRALFILAHRIYLTKIRNSYSTLHDCLRELLRKWLQEYPANWGHIIMALRELKSLNWQII